MKKLVVRGRFGAFFGLVMWWLWLFDVVDVTNYLDPDGANFFSVGVMMFLSINTVIIVKVGRPPMVVSLVFCFSYCQFL
jgi:hypothetical protein